MKDVSQTTRQRGARAGLLAGVVAPVMNVLVFSILGATRPGYSSLRLPDSLLERGPGGWIQITNYVVTGVLLVAFSWALHHRGRVPRPWVPVLVAVYGLTFGGLALFVTDPALNYPPGAAPVTTIGGILHSVFGQLQFVSLATACFVMARGDSLRTWRWYSLMTGVVLLAADILFVVTFKTSGPAGLVARIGIVSGSLWVVLLAVRALKGRPAVS